MQPAVLDYHHGRLGDDRRPIVWSSAPPVVQSWPRLQRADVHAQLLREIWQVDRLSVPDGHRRGELGPVPALRLGSDVGRYPTCGVS